MHKDFYYNTKTISFPDRETFNNTILLLTMVRSQYYYIVGFSRPNNVIEIAFDYESDLHSVITESITLHFGESEDNVILRCKIKNLKEEMCVEHGIISKGKGIVKCCETGFNYEYYISKDKLIPVSVENMNLFILEAKEEIIDFIEKQYSKYLCK